MPRKPARSVRIVITTGISRGRGWYGFSAGAALAVDVSAQSFITGPTTSTGEYTLTWPDQGNNYLREVQSNTQYFTSPTSFNRSPGTYDYEWYLHIYAPEFGINSHFLVDTHQVVVSDGGAPPGSPPLSHPHIVRVGDLGNNGLLDFAITAANPAQRLIEDFILRQVSPGVFQVLVNPTNQQLQAGRNWPVSNARAVVTEFNMNQQLDVALVNASAAIPGASDHVILANPQTSNAHPTVAVRITPERTAFVEEVHAATGDPQYYANAISQQCVTQTGWYLVTAYITQPGWYINEFFQYVYISQPGFYTVFVYLQSGYCFDVVNPNVVSSVPALYFHVASEVFATSAVTAERQQAVQLMQALLAEFLATPFGAASYQPPYANLDVTEAVYSQLWWAVRNLCIFRPGLVCELEEVIIAFETTCLTGLSPQNWSSPIRWRMPKVSHPSGQNFATTTTQHNARAAGDRLAFWTSRLNHSRDPLGPLAIDIVNNTPILGCGANQRLLAFAHAAAISVSLNDVGLDLIDQHILRTSQDSDGILGKLDVQRVAEYHFDVFGILGLPNRTFGGTPMTGSLEELRVTRHIWCPSCEHFP